MKLLELALSAAKKKTKKEEPRPDKDPLTLAMEEFIRAENAGEKKEALQTFLELSKEQPEPESSDD